jgi:hypothetical protein
MDSGEDLTVALVVMTMGMAAATSMATKMTAGVASKQTVSATEVCLMRTSAEALRRMSAAKKVKAARPVCFAGGPAGKGSSLPKPLTTIAPTRSTEALCRTAIDGLVES